MERLFTFFVLPILASNFLGGLIGGIWLLINGDWQLVVGGIGYGIAGPMIIAILLAPGLLLAAPMLKLMEEGHTKLALFMGLPSMFWTYAVVTATCLFVFSVVMQNTDGKMSLPYLLWSYSTATAPWSYMAKKEHETGNQESATVVFFAQIGIIVLAIRYLIGNDSLELWDLAAWFAPVMIVGVLAQLLMAYAEYKSRQHYERFNQFDY